MRTPAHIDENSRLITDPNEIARRRAEAVSRGPPEPRIWTATEPASQFCAETQAGAKATVSKPITIDRSMAPQSTLLIFGTTTRYRSRRLGATAQNPSEVTGGGSECDRRGCEFGASQFAEA